MNRFVVPCLIPFGLAFLWLLMGLIGMEVNLSSVLLWGILAGSILCPFALIVAARRDPDHEHQWMRLAVLAPCFLAPLSILHVWAIVPSPMGVGLGGLQTFLHWLTKYPNWGPVNMEILLGILCVLGAGATPVGFGLAALKPKVHRWVLVLLAIGWAIPFVTVVLYLDGTLWWLGTTSFPSFGGPVTDRSVLYGPILRAMPVISMGVVLLGNRR